MIGFMNQTSMCPIVFSEWLPTGIMVHFEGGLSVFFPASFLYGQREIHPNQMFQTDPLTPKVKRSIDGIL